MGECVGAGRDDRTMGCRELVAVRNDLGVLRGLEQRVDERGSASRLVVVFSYRGNSFAIVAWMSAAAWRWFVAFLMGLPTTM